MKKKLFLITTFIIASVLVLINVGEKEVKAEENCRNQVYYYMFLDSSNKVNFNFSSGRHIYTTEKFFKAPAEVDATGYNLKVVSHGKVEVTYDSTVSAFAPKSRMPLGFFQNKMLAMKKSGKYQTGYEDNGNIYIAALPWSESGSQSGTTTSTPMPETYAEFSAQVPVFDNTTFATYKTTINSELQNNVAPPTTTRNIGGTSTTGIFFEIERYWDSGDLDDIADNSIVWSPAVYYVEYEICAAEEILPPAPEEKYTITVRYVNKDDGLEIAEDYTLKDNVPSGTPYEYNCDDKKINNYALYKGDEANYPTTFEGTVTKNDTLTCYYTKAETYKLTVEHYEEGNTKDKLVEDFTKSGYASGEDYTYKCQSVPGYTVVNSSNNPSTLEGTFDNSNITRQCYYTKNTYTLTVNYGQDEDCTKLLGDPYTTKLKYKENTKVKVPDSFGKMTNPTLGTFSSQFTTKPNLDGNYLNVTMPAKDVSVCIVYTAQTGSSWIYLAWVIGGLALGYSIWYFVRYFKRQNSEV